MYVCMHACIMQVRIAMASLEDTNSAKRVEENRSLVIEAAITRIMKVIILPIHAYHSYTYHLAKFESLPTWPNPIQGT